MVAVFAAVIGISNICRGHERTVGDLKRIAGRLHNFFAISPAEQHSIETIERGRQGYWKPTIRYPGKLIGIIIEGRREGPDILANDGPLERAWRKVCPDQPLTIQFLGPSAIDPTTGGRITASNHPPEPIDKFNFQEQLPLLKDIRDLILESGDGYGELPIRGYPAEPTEFRCNPINGPEAASPWPA